MPTAHAAQQHPTSHGPGQVCPILTLAELHVRVLPSFIKLIKLWQNLMKLLPNFNMV